MLYNQNFKRDILVIEKYMRKYRDVKSLMKDIGRYVSLDNPVIMYLLQHWEIVRVINYSEIKGKLSDGLSCLNWYIEIVDGKVKLLAGYTSEEIEREFTEYDDIIDFLENREIFLKKFTCSISYILRTVVIF